MEVGEDDKSHGERLGILAAIFANGAIEVRVIPRAAALNSSSSSSSSSSSCRVPYRSLDDLPGCRLALPFLSHLSHESSLPSITPTSLRWSTQCDEFALLAVGASGGQVAVFEMTWQGRTKEGYMTPCMSMSQEQKRNGRSNTLGFEILVCDNCSNC